MSTFKDIHMSALGPFVFPTFGYNLAFKGVTKIVKYIVCIGVQGLTLTKRIEQ